MHHPLKKLFIFNNDNCFDFKTVPRLEGILYCGYRCIVYSCVAYIDTLHAVDIIYIISIRYLPNGISTNVINNRLSLQKVN